MPDTPEPPVHEALNRAMPDTPEPCGCRTEGEYFRSIVYCPTHAAARALRADMSNIFEAVMTEENMDMKSMRQTLDFVGAIAARALEDSRAAIAQATQGEASDE